MYSFWSLRVVVVVQTTEQTRVISITSMTDYMIQLCLSTALGLSATKKTITKFKKPQNIQLFDIYI